ncbi:MAG: prenyltransferase/squalene oxidase repeat-containing protein [Planctomycetota bacterium]|nr:prenyltransferase/squalene oxidase repeat-containing protein [Planctomycetota bacterium]
MPRLVLQTTTALFWWCGWHSAYCQDTPHQPQALLRAVAYLQGEVRQWPEQHHCYSCHNNGDAARALFVARSAGIRVPQQALNRTTNWLARPGSWKNNGGDQRFSDQRLAQFQFSLALAAAHRAELLSDPLPLLQAATATAKQQQPDGSWALDTGGIVASPITYGRHLGTALGKNLLQQVDAKAFSLQITKAEKWLRQSQPHAIPDLSGLMIGLRESQDPAALKQLDRCQQLLRSAQAPAGGWGPFATHRAEPYDTAIALIALAQQKPNKPYQPLLQAGRSWLIKQQLEDGSWAETTRPADSESYAHRISTTAWASLALIATQELLQSK